MFISPWERNIKSLQVVEHYEEWKYKEKKKNSSKKPYPVLYKSEMSGFTSVLLVIKKSNAVISHILGFSRIL